MTKTTKNKYVRQEVLYDYVLPEDDEQVVRVKHGRGNNLHEVETASGEVFLASMPSKFRRVIWIKRGDFVIVKPIKEGVKVKAEITHILLKDQINYIKEEGRWPVAFDTGKENSGDSTNEDSFVINPEKSVVQKKNGSLDDELLANTNRQIIEGEDTESSNEESSDKDLFVNTNRQFVECKDTESSDEESSDEDLFVNTNREIVECEDTESSDEESSDEELFVNANRQAAALEQGTESPVES